MGAYQSTGEVELPPAATEPIVPQPTPICATETRFCLPRNIKLHLNCPSSEDDFCFTEDGNRRVVYFKCNGHEYGCFSNDLGKRKILRDNVGATVLYMKRKEWGILDGFNIYADVTKMKHICKIKPHVAFMKTNFSVEFSDVFHDGIQRVWWLKGNIQSYCNIYSGHPKEGGVLIARMTSQGNEWFWSAVDFTVEIAANVDIAVVAMLCILVEQSCRDTRKDYERDRGCI